MKLLLKIMILILDLNFVSLPYTLKVMAIKVIIRLGCRLPYFLVSGPGAENLNALSIPNYGVY